MVEVKRARSTWLTNMLVTGVCAIDEVRTDMPGLRLGAGQMRSKQSRVTNAAAGGSVKELARRLGESIAGARFLSSRNAE